MPRTLALAFLALFTAVLAVDSFDSDCVLETDPAHACLCATPAAPAAAGCAVKAAPGARPREGYRAPAFAGRLADKSLFQPPKAA